MTQTKATEASVKPKSGSSLLSLKGFIGHSQLAAVKSAMRGEEGSYFREKLAELANVVTTMPETYGQDGKGEEAVVFLHYFTGGCDWFITEKDKGDSDDEPQHFQSQAFGMADFGHGGELGYISLPEILKNGAEMDFHWTPKTIAECRKKRGAK